MFLSFHSSNLPKSLLVITPLSLQWLPSSICHSFWSYWEYVLSLSTRSLMISEHYQSQYCLLRHAFINGNHADFKTIDCLTWPASLWSFLLDAIQSIPPPSGYKVLGETALRGLLKSAEIIRCPLCILKAYCSIIENRSIDLIFFHLICLFLVTSLSFGCLEMVSKAFFIKLQGLR